MAKKWYLLNKAAPYSPATFRGAWDQTTGALTKALDAHKEGGGSITNLGLAETNASPTFDVLVLRFVSGPLAAQTIAGTLNACVAISESAASADMNWHLHVYVTQGDSDTPRGTILTDYVESAGVNEWPTTHTFKALNAAQTLSSLAVSAGDRLVAELGFISREASATSRTGRISYGTETVLGPADDGTVGSILTTTLANFLEFSQDILEASDSVDLRVSQMVVEVFSENVAEGTDPGGGGDPGTGVDPSADVSLCGAVSPIDWITLQTDSGEKVYARGDIAVDNTFKQARLISISPFVRALSDRTGRLETARTTITLSDYDRALRGLAASGTLLNKRVDVYVASLAHLRAGSTARRVAQLVVRDFYPDADLTFVLQCEDYFGSVVGEYGTPRLIPSRVFTATDFPNCGPNTLGTAVPIVYGLQSDEADGANAIGVIPAIPVGPRRLSDGQDWEEFVIAGHAIASIVSWFASNLAEDPRPAKMSDDTEGTEFLIPGFAGWVSIVGASPYVDYNGRRYTSIFAIGQRATDAVSGAVPISVNLGGVEDVGDGSGTMIDNISLQKQHFVTHFGLLDYQGGSWPAIPSANGYSRIDTASFADEQAIQVLRIGGSGYLGAIYFGWQGEQINLLEALRRLAQDSDGNWGIDRHGRVMTSAVYSLASTVKAFDGVNDVIEKSFTVKRRFELLANRVTLKFRRNYIPDSRPDSSRTGVPWWSDYYHTTIDTSDTGSIAAIAETRTLAFDGECLRDAATAADVADQLLSRNANGPIYVAFTTNLCGLDVELGDKITVSHFAGMSSTGWTDKAIRVERLTVNLDEMTVTIEGQTL